MPYGSETSNKDSSGKIAPMPVATCHKCGVLWVADKQPDHGGECVSCGKQTCTKCLGRVEFNAHGLVHIHARFCAICRSKVTAAAKRGDLAPFIGLLAKASHAHLMHVTGGAGRTGKE
jgi:hypothetical protein